MGSLKNIAIYGSIGVMLTTAAIAEQIKAFGNVVWPNGNSALETTVVSDYETVGVDETGGFEVILKDNTPVNFQYKIPVGYKLGAMTPNPSVGESRTDVSIPQGNNLVDLIAAYNVKGELIKSAKNVPIGQMSLDLGDIAAGLVIYRVVDDGVVMNGRMMHMGGNARINFNIFQGVNYSTPLINKTAEDDDDSVVKFSNEQELIHLEMLHLMLIWVN